MKIGTEYDALKNKGFRGNQSVPSSDLTEATDKKQAQEEIGKSRQYCLVLDAYVRLGELLPPAEVAQKQALKKGNETQGRSSSRGTTSPLPDGVDMKKAHLARKLAAGGSLVF